MSLTSMKTFPIINATCGGDGFASKISHGGISIQTSMRPSGLVSLMAIVSLLIRSLAPIWLLVLRGADMTRYLWGSTITARQSQGLVVKTDDW